LALGFPDVYEVGMSHLGFRLLHASLCDRADVEVERVFLPWPDLQARLQQTSTPLATLESFTPLAEFDLLGLSVQYELALSSVLKLLDLAGIPRRTAVRAASGTWPLILLGGTAALNPEPIAPFVDAVFVGEADQAIHEIVDCLVQHRDAPRARRLTRLAAIGGVYIPELHDATYGEGDDDLAVRVQPLGTAARIMRRYVEDLDLLPIPRTHPVPYCAIVHDRVAIEIQRGCCQGCRFCQAGFATRPVRQRGVDAVLDAARRLLGATGYEALSLLSLSAGDHPCLQQMLSALIQEHGPRRVSVSLPSLRTETLHPTVAEQIGRVRRSSFTLAPEAATDRLRRVINKGNTEADLMQSVRAVARAGWSQLKLYFMIGLPTETEEDVAAIADLAHRVYDELRRHAGKGAGLHVAVSTFVPKPHTPFQWEAAPTLASVERAQQILVQRMPRRVRLKWHDPGQSLVEAYLARADRRMAGVLERLVTAEHTALDAWSEHFDLQRWQTALAEAHAAGEIPAPERLLGRRDPEAPLPWDHLDLGVTRAHLEAQRRAAHQGGLRPDCSDGTCDVCGVCPDEPLHRIARETSAARETLTTREAGGPQPPTEDGGPCSVRLWFRKEGRARLLSHLEMAGVFERAVRRAGLPVAFSGGFHPKVRLRFSPALALGAESWCEFAELALSRRLEPAMVARALAQQLPTGLSIERAEAAEGNLQRRISGVRWRFEPGQTAEQLVERGRQRLASGSLLVTRRAGRAVDLAHAVVELSAGPPGSLEVICRFGPDGTARPSELLTALLELDADRLGETRIIRVGWVLDPDGSQGQERERE